MKRCYTSLIFQEVVSCFFPSISNPSRKQIHWGSQRIFHGPSIMTQRGLFQRLPFLFLMIQLSEFILKTSCAEIAPSIVSSPVLPSYLACLSGMRLPRTTDRCGSEILCWGLSPTKPSLYEIMELVGVQQHPSRKF